ncbi:MAG: T9SS type A sorting domain-containing protein [Bacteroidota bacterium]
MLLLASHTLPRPLAALVLLGLLWVSTAPKLHAQDAPLLDTGLVQTALLPNGFVGADNGAGTGFVFDGDQGLYEGQFLVGLGPDNVIGQPYSSADGAPPAEWTSTSGLTSIPPVFGFDQGVETAFEAVSGEVSVTVRGFARTDDPYVILEYVVTNTTDGPLDEVYLGLFADWDVGDAAQNTGAFIERNGLVYVFDESEASTNVFGTVSLNLESTPVSGYSLSAEPTDAGLYTSLTTLGEEEEPAGDRRTVVGVGPYLLGVDESVVARFALAGEAGRSDLSRAASQAQEDSEGTVLSDSVDVDGVMRDYFLYVPFQYDGMQSLPLVLNYHGFNCPGDCQSDVSQMNTVANEEHFLVAYPQGLDVFEPTIFMTLGPGWVVPGALPGQQDDIAFTKALIEQVNQDYGVTLDRVHATGWSNGAIYSFRLACALPMRIASVAGVAGHMNEALIESCTTDQRVSTLLFYGTADPILPFDGVPEFYPVVTATPEFWAEQNGCSDVPNDSLLVDLDPDDGSTVTRLDYPGCQGDNEVVFYRIDGGGHGWPGSGLGDDFLGPTNNDIDASREIWTFFEENPLVVSNEDDASLPKGITLLAAYPNPVVRATTMGFVLPEPEQVRLTVHDVLGRRVAVVVDEVRPAGTHEVRVDASRLASGTYLYRLTAGAETATATFTVVR